MYLYSRTIIAAGDEKKTNGDIFVLRIVPSNEEIEFRPLLMDLWVRNERRNRKKRIDFRHHDVEKAFVEICKPFFIIRKLTLRHDSKFATCSAPANFYSHLDCFRRQRCETMCAQNGEHDPIGSMYLHIQHSRFMRQAQFVARNLWFCRFNFLYGTIGYMHWVEWNGKSAASATMQICIKYTRTLFRRCNCVRCATQIVHKSWAFIPGFNYYHFNCCSRLLPTRLILISCRVGSYLSRRVKLVSASQTLRSRTLMCDTGIGCKDLYQQ